eukprot:101959-Rhodomonas_salina.3
MPPCSGVYESVAPPPPPPVPAWPSCGRSTQPPSTFSGGQYHLTGCAAPVPVVLQIGTAAAAGGAATYPPPPPPPPLPPLLAAQLPSPSSQQAAPPPDAHHRLSPVMAITPPSPPLCCDWPLCVAPPPPAPKTAPVDADCSRAEDTAELPPSYPCVLSAHCSLLTNHAHCQPCLRTACPPTQTRDSLAASCAGARCIALAPAPLPPAAPEQDVPPPPPCAHSFLFDVCSTIVSLPLPFEKHCVAPHPPEKLSKAPASPPEPTRTVQKPGHSVTPCKYTICPAPPPPPAPTPPAPPPAITRIVASSGACTCRTVSAEVSVNAMYTSPPPPSPPGSTPLKVGCGPERRSTMPSVHRQPPPSHTYPVLHLTASSTLAIRAPAACPGPPWSHSVRHVAS